MIITSKFLKKSISIFERKNNSILLLAPVTLTPPKPSITLEPVQNVVDGVITIGEIGLKGLELLGKLAEYIANPISFIIDIWNGIHYISYPLLLGFALFSLFMYVMGYEKFAKNIPLCAVIFAFIQAVGRF